MLGTWLGIGSAAKLGLPSAAAPGCVLRDVFRMFRSPAIARWPSRGGQACKTPVGSRCLNAATSATRTPALCRWIGVCGTVAGVEAAGCCCINQRLGIVYATLWADSSQAEVICSRSQGAPARVSANRSRLHTEAVTCTQRTSAPRTHHDPPTTACFSSPRPHFSCLGRQPSRPARRHG